MDWIGPVYFICFGIAAVALWWWIEKRRIRSHQSKLSKLRPNLSLDRFVSQFRNQDIDGEIAAWVREEIGGYKYTDMEVHWDDQIWNFYRIDDEELDFILRRAFAHFAIPLPDWSKPETLPNLLTVGHCISYIDMTFKTSVETAQQHQNRH